MKRTKLRRLLPLLLTLVTVISCIFGITVAANDTTHSNEIKFASVVLNNDVDVLFWVDMSEEDAQNKNTFMTFNDGTPVSYAETKTYGDATYVVYRYNDVLPQDIGKSVTAKLYVDGAMNSISTFNVKDYCQYILTNSQSSSLKTLVSDLLVYGMETQLLLGESEENLVTNGITGLTPSETPDDMKVLYGTEILDDLTRGETCTIGSSKVDMVNGVQLTFSVNIPEGENPSNYFACLTINGREQEVRITQVGTGYKATFNGFYAYELFDQATVALYKNRTRVSKTMTLCLASYIDALNNNEKYTAVTNAFYNYAYSAHIYGGAHTLSMPGDLDAKGFSSLRYDDYGTMTYSCSLCGEIIDAIHVSHIRNFETSHTNGSVANKDGNKTLFTITTESELFEDNSSNRYLSVVRNYATDFGSGSLGYYITPEHTDYAGHGGNVDEYGQFTTDKYTYSFSIKAPEAGLAATAVYLQNTNTTSSSKRYCLLFEVTDAGAIQRDASSIAPVGTVNSDSWTDVTVTMEFYEKDGEKCIYLEYYVNNQLITSFSVTNTLLNGRFNRIHLSLGTSGLEDGQGVYWDNFMLALDCVHSFTDDVVTHIKKENNGNLRQIIDRINNDFDATDFSTVVRWDGKSEKTYTETQWLVGMPTDAHPDPLATPKNYQHPRLLFNSSDIPAIIANMEKPENAATVSAFLSRVNSDVDGKLTPTEYITPASFEYTNYDTTVLKAIEAKAMYYAIYKNSAGHDDALLRGYEAIYAIKNYLLTFDVQWDFSDQCRMYGEVMYHTALVYDWCYDLLTDEDKTQLMLGVQNLCCDGTSNSPWLGTTHEGRKLEGGFPALGVENQSPLTGHGAEAQVLRDYFSFAIAIFDEDPTWYDYVGGMIYANYVDARNYFYTASYYPDGAAGYNVYRYVCDLYNAWLFKGMGVELPYNEEDMASVIHGLMSMEINDNFMFATADGSGTSSYGQYRLNTTVGDAALISSYLFDDNTALQIALRLCAYSYGASGFTHQLGISSAYYLILTANNLETTIGDYGPENNYFYDTYRDKIANVEYHGGFQQQVVSRDSKDDDSVVVLTQGAQHYPGGHTHQNAGSFQIWYKGMLTRDDGLYDAYGSDHHFYYHMSGTSHNTLLIYNNEMRNSPIGPNNKIGYYNGAQKYELGIPASFNNWLNDNKFSYGKLIGIQTDDEMNPSYVYFANDITNAYDSDTVDYVERSTMTLYTGDEETPMVMFIYDNITADDPNFQKTFLLQCVSAPEIDYENGTVTVDNGEGKLVLTSLLGADSIKAYGRTSKDGVVKDIEYFYVLDENGVPKRDENGDFILSKEYGAERFYLSGAGTSLNPGGAEMIGDKNSDLSIVWGHVEIQPNVGNYTNQLVNVLYVSDSGTTVTATPTLLQSAFMTGATFKNHTTMFVTDSLYASDEHMFETTGEGTMTYYIGGINEGTWTVTINGNEIGKFEATDEGKMISFEGETGTVVLTPSNTRPAGTSAIRYILNGGTMTESAPSYYYHGEVTALPTPTKIGATFEGWYTDKECQNKISEITAEYEGTLMLYAKWSAPIVDAEYSKGGTLGDYGVLSHNPDGGGTFKVVNGEESYLVWADTDSNGSSIIGRDGKYSQYANDSLKVSFVLTLGRNGDDTLLPFSIYLRDTKTTTGSNRFLNIFRMDASGKLYLGQSIQFDQLPSAGMMTIRFVLDFESGKMFAYNENGDCIKETSMSSAGIKVPTEYKSYEDWFRNLSGTGSSLITMKAAAAGSIRIGKVQVLSGNVSESCKNFGANSTTHTWNEGIVITPASTTNCMPGVIRYSCVDCYIYKDAAIVSEIPHATMTETHVGGDTIYACGQCGCSFTPMNDYYLDGTNYDNIIGTGNAKDYITLDGTNQPVINNKGQFELINDSGNRGALELWIPSMGDVMGGFNSTNKSLGFVSLKVNALTEENINFNFVDTSSDGARWSSDWCITDAFISIGAPVSANGRTTVTVKGWDSTILKSIDLTSEADFTGWIDIKACIELNPDNDTITLHYYVDGHYVATVSRALTTSTNAINSICITGYTSNVGSGIKLDDISFGYTANGNWVAEEK